MGFSKTLVTEQTTGCHKVEDSNLMYICMWLLFRRMTIILSFLKLCFGDCISSHHGVWRVGMFLFSGAHLSKAMLVLWTQWSLNL